MMTVQKVIPQLKHSIRKSLAFVGILWIVFIVQRLLGIDPGWFGIIPGTLRGLPGIFTAPLTHGGFMHLISNSIPLLVQLTFAFLIYPRAMNRVIPLLFLFTGIMVWITGEPGSSHIGASGILYGITAFLFFSGLFRKDLASLVVSVLIAFFYGGMLWGIFPGDPGVSYQSHMYGALGGALLALAFRNFDREQPRRYDWEQEPDYHPGDDFAEWNYRREIFPPRNPDEE